MVRLRLASLGLAASLGLVGGCLNPCDRPLLSRLRPCCPSECCDCPADCCEGPLLGNGGPVASAPVVAQPPAAVPQLAPAPQPRLVPQPQATPAPYNPQ